jgi:hypothetical protein
MQQVFEDDDNGYTDWIRTNPAGFVVNAQRNPKPDYLILHRASCRTISPTPDKAWTRQYIKICSTSREQLENWARRKIHGELHPCGLCAP